MTSERERAQTIALGRGERRPYERDATIHELFARRAEQTPDAIAVRDAATVLTYGELDARSNRLAHYLRSLGVGPRASIGIALERSAVVPVVLLGILKAGAAYVPLDVSYPLERLRFMIDDANVGLIVSDERSRSRLPLCGTAIVALDADGDAIGAQSARSPGVPGSAESRAYVMYTSGSTGRAKGVAVPHRGIVRLVRNTDFVAIGSDDVYLQYAPLAFDASTFELWAPLLNGGTLAVAPPGLLAIDELGRELDRFAVTTLWLTAAMFRAAMERPPAAFARLRALITGGDVVSAAHARRFVETFPGVRLINGYGPTENTTFSCCYTVTPASAIGERVPIGRPIANASAYVVDEQLQPVPAGVAGELCVGGDGVAVGYLHAGDLTAERFIADPFADRAGAMLYRTGDRARWRADGLLEFLGRADRQVKIRGYRIELDEIETQLLALPGVAQAAVVVADTASDKAAFAFVAPAAGAALDERGVRALLHEALPAYMVPQHIAIVAQLPMHPSGKVDRIALAREAVASAPPAAPVASATPALRPRALHGAIAEIWREVLAVATAPEPDTNFFDAGGDSLLLLTLQGKLSERLDVRVSVMDLFEHPTIRTLATFIGATASPAVR